MMLQLFQTVASDGVTSEKALNLGPITESHAGNYTCYVVNPYGNASYTTIVSVTGELSSVFKFATPRIAYVAAGVDPKLAVSGFWSNIHHHGFGRLGPTCSCSCPWVEVPFSKSKSCSDILAQHVMRRK